MSPVLSRHRGVVQRAAHRLWLLPPLRILPRTSGSKRTTGACSRAMLMIDAVYPHFIRMAELEPSSAEWISELGEAARAAADGADELVQPAGLRREVVGGEHPGLARVLGHGLVFCSDHEAELLEGGRAVEMTLAVLVDDELA